MRALNKREKELVAEVQRRPRAQGVASVFPNRVHYHRQSTHGSIREAASRNDPDYDPLTITVATVVSWVKDGAPIRIRIGVAKRSPRDAEDKATGRNIAFVRALRAKPVRVA